MANKYVSSLAAGAGDGSVGSPWTLQQAHQGAGDGDLIFVKNDGIYLRGASLEQGAQSGQYASFIGYTATEWDGGIATIRATTGGVQLLRRYNPTTYMNLRFEDGAAGIVTVNDSSVLNCSFSNCGVGFDSLGDPTGNSVANRCTATGCGFGFRGGNVYNCRTENCSTGFENTRASHCIGYKTGSSSTTAFHFCSISRCIAYNSNTIYFISGNTVADLVAVNTPVYCLPPLVRSARFNAPLVITPQHEIGPINLTADPFLSGTTGDFRLTQQGFKELQTGGFDIPLSWRADPIRDNGYIPTVWSD